MSEQNFGAPNHYYAQPIHNRLHGPANDTPAERQVREILATNDEVFEKVDKTCKRWNPIIREILRSETALKLSINEDRRIIPVRADPEFITKYFENRPNDIVKCLREQRCPCHFYSSSQSHIACAVNNLI